MEGFRRKWGRKKLCGSINLKKWKDEKNEKIKKFLKIQLKSILKTI